MSLEIIFYKRIFLMAVLGATFFGNVDEDDLLQQKSLKTKW